MFRSYDLRKPEKSGDIAGHKLNQFNQFNGTITEQYTEQETWVVVCSVLSTLHYNPELRDLLHQNFPVAGCWVQFIAPRLAQLGLMFLIFDQR